MPAWKPRGAWAVSACGYDVHVGRLIHMNGRVYDPQLSRFLSPDPLVQAPTNSQSWNRYSYVFNNPLKYIDPTGYEGCSAQADACGVKPKGCDATCKELINRTAAQAFLNAFLSAGASLTSDGKVGFNGQTFDANDPNLLSKMAGAVKGGQGLAKLNNILVALAIAAANIEEENPTINGEPVVAMGVPNPRLIGLAIATKLGLMKTKIGATGGPGAGKSFSEKIKAQAREESDNTCVFCGTNTKKTDGPDPQRSHIDHAIPKSRSGNNTLDNAQNTCQSCNLDKGTMTTEEYLNKIIGL